MGDWDPDWTIAPGATLADWIEENGLSVRSTAIACGRMDPDRLQRIIDGKQKLTRDDAARLHAGTMIPARLWLNLERRYREDLKRGKIDTTGGQ
jgi:plasmid maintenance system antidote protein VapI